MAVRGAALALCALGLGLVVAQHGARGGLLDSVTDGLSQAANTARGLFRQVTGVKGSTRAPPTTRPPARQSAGKAPAPSSSARGSSNELLKKFKSQSSSVPQVDLSESVQSVLSPLRSVASTAQELIGSLLKQPLRIRGELSAPMARYSEPYTIWYDPASGATRVDMHGGATSSYVVPLPDGRLQRVEVRRERWNGSSARRCTKGAPYESSAATRVLSVLPDFGLFTFSGLADGGAQRWLHQLVGRVGELGAAPGEVLSFKHELLFVQGPGGIPLPTKYSVSVDSSVLGAASDGFAHAYQEVLPVPHDPATLAPPPGLCDGAPVEPDSPQLRARLDPLAEFSMQSRDTRYDALLDQFKVSNVKQYIDNVEEAIRKNLFVQHSRFIESWNRRGASFALEANFLADQLEEELAMLRGGGDDDDGSSRPSAAPTRAVRKRAAPADLPAQFDWRTEGAVSPVQNQTSLCKSCWAFAVAGAVEGALFVRTRKLVPLSVQALVDCGKEYGANGCSGTWPEDAYKFVKVRGLPPTEDYGPYKAAVETCHLRESSGGTTRIAEHQVVPKDVASLQAAIHETGPVVVVVNSKPWQFVFFSKGVFEDKDCLNERPHLDHAVLAVGWGPDEKTGQLYFTLKNSWTDKWGEAGYLRVAAHANTCGVLSKASRPILGP